MVHFAAAVYNSTSLPLDSPTPFGPACGMTVHDPFELDATDLEDLATGAWILGTGGGGDPDFSLFEFSRL